jgi:hypothetical protein
MQKRPSPLIIVREHLLDVLRVSSRFLSSCVPGSGAQRVAHRIVATARCLQKRFKQARHIVHVLLRQRTADYPLNIIH